MDWLTRLRQSLTARWQRMTLVQRWAGGFLLLLFLTAAYGIWHWYDQSQFATLYHDLTPEEAAAVVAKLDSSNVRYQLRARGTTVVVPADRIDKLRIELAGENLPVKASKGFEIFDESPLGMTPFLQHVNYLRALQSELARTIMRLEPVAQARVHIVRPEPSPFIREQKPTTASVVVWLKPNSHLQRSMVQGIVAFVARSVEGLNPENVTLLDNTGRILSETRSGEDGAVPATQVEYRHEVERSLAAKAEEMLARLLGPSKAVVRVTADINFRRQSETRETYSPEERVVTSETINNVKSTGPAPGARGVAGVTPNVGRAPATTPASTESKTTEETIDTKYAVSKTVQKIEEKYGDIERLSIAAIVDLTQPDGTASSMTAKEVEEIVKQAVGFKTGRDQIRVSEVKLAAAVEPPADAEYAQLQRWQWYLKLGLNVSFGVAVLVALAFSYMLLRRLLPPVSPPPAPAERERRLQAIVTAAQQNPEAMARLLSAWMGPREPPAKGAAA